MKNLIPVFLVLIMSLTSCLGNDEVIDYTEWKLQNEDYVATAESKMADGKLFYEKISPVWAPGIFVLMKWHNDRLLTQDKLSPMSNSLVDVKYEFENIDGSVSGNSYSQTDSIYQCRPNQNILGFWTALTNMHVGDSVTVVIPYQAAYGINGNTTIAPYSTLIYRIKLKSIVAYEAPN